jgi:hypothetical protein
LGEVLVGVGYWVKVWMNHRLAKVLQDRKDWHNEELAGERFWCFGVDNAARLIIAPLIYGFLVYRVGDDRSSVRRRIESVKAWLEANETTLAGPTPQVNCQEALERARTGRKGQ